MRLLWEVGQRSFRRAATYRLATASGAFTNTVFGYIRAAVLITVATQAGGAIRGFTGTELATFAFMSQALIMTVGVFSPSDLPQRIRTGDVEVDLYRPCDLQLWELATWSGRAGFFVVARGLPPVLLGSLAFDLEWPDHPGTWAAFAVTVALASLVGFAVRFVAGLTAFWLIDIRGIEQMVTILIMFFGGLLLPVNLFPPWLEQVARVLPFASMLQMPVEVFLESHSGPALVSAIARQALWAVVLFTAGRLVLGAATRRLVVQGG